MQHFVMRTARQHSIPVLLDGQGGDETLLGYRHYFAGVMCSVLRRRGFRAMLGELHEFRRNRSQMSSSTIWLREHAGEMRREVLESPLIAELSRPGILEHSYGSLHHAVRWRLYSVALWARLFDVT